MLETDNLEEIIADTNILIVEPQVDAKVRVERDGVAIHRRTEVLDQPSDGQLGVPACLQGRS